MKFVIHHSKNGQIHFDIVADNGEILAHSEDYQSLNSCKHAISLIQKQASTATIQEKHNSINSRIF